MPLGINRVGSFRKGTKLSLPHEFGHLIDMPHEFGNPIGESEDLYTLQNRLDLLLLYKRQTGFPEGTTASCNLGTVVSVGTSLTWYARLWSRLRGK